jgi:hypothetical protein
VEECERLNEELSQNHKDSTSTNFGDGPNDAFASVNDQSPIHSVNGSPANFYCQAADDFHMSEDESNTYVIALKLFFIIKDITSILISSFPIVIKNVF